MSNETSYEAPPYEASTQVKLFYSTPRFGHSNDIVTLVDGDERYDYVRGLLFASIFCFIIFLVWAFLLLIFKCCGKDRVGFLAGTGFRPNPGCCCPFSSRFIVVLSTAILIVSCVLISTKGVHDITGAVSHVEDSSELLGNFTSQLKDIMDDLDTVGRSAIPLRDEIVLLLGGDLCPNQDQLQTAIDTLQNNGVDATDELNQLQIIDTFKENALAATDKLTILSNFINGIVTNFSKIYTSYTDYKTDADDWLAKLKKNIIWLAYFVIPIGVFASLFCLAVFLQVCGLSAGIFQCLLNWFLLPVFILMVLVFMIAGLFVYPLGIINSDFCLNGSKSGSPDGTIKSFMVQQGMDLTTMSSKVLLYYMEGCLTEDPLGSVRDFSTDVTEASGAISDVNLHLADNSDVLSSVCGTDYGPLAAELDKLTGLFGTLVNAADKALNLSKCENINTIYVSFTHEAVCTELPHSIAWVFGTFIVITITGFVIITFRAAWKDVADESYSSRDARYEKKSRPQAAIY
mmetsp:Transcript_21100/g.29565  ORF Transcript_21100/g.29565 Transcript_21100/m.29565 type:complete len:516 (+) Transcript_21100:84-1631(+)